MRANLLVDPLIDNLNKAIIACDHVAALNIIGKNGDILKKHDSHGVTPLQQTFFTGDSEFCKVIADQLDPQEIKNQFDEVTDGDFIAFDRMQRQKANELFASLDLERLIVDATYKYYDGFHVCLNDTKDHNLALQKAIDDFSIKLENYSNNNKVYNPYIFLKAADLYRRIFNLEKCDNKREKLELLSSQIIGKIQTCATAVWKKRFAKGVFRLWVSYQPAPQYLFIHYDNTTHLWSHHLILIMSLNLEKQNVLTYTAG